MLKQKIKIPEGWKEYDIKNICDILIGGTPARNNEDFWDTKKETDNVWVSIRDMSNSGKYISGSAEYISDEGVKKSNVKLIPKDTLIMSFKLSIGKVAITKKELYTNEAIAAFVVKDKNLLDSNYLYYAVSGLNYDFDTAVKGKTLNKEKLLNTQILLPPLAIQNKIAEILGAVDREIEKIELIIEKSEILKNSQLNKIFNTKNKIIKLGDYVSHVGSGSTPRGGEDVYLKKGIPFIRSQNVYFDGLRTNDIVYISNEIDQQMKRSKVTPKDVLLNITGASIGRACIVPDDLFKANVNQHVCIVRPKDKLLPEFLFYFFQSKIGQNQIMSLQAGGNRQGLNFQQIRSFKIFLPPLEKQKESIGILSIIDEKNSIYKKIKNNFSQLRKGLTADLLGGTAKI